MPTCVAATGQEVSGYFRRDMDMFARPGWRKYIFHNLDQGRVGARGYVTKSLSGAWWPTILSKTYWHKP